MGFHSHLFNTSTVRAPLNRAEQRLSMSACPQGWIPSVLQGLSSETQSRRAMVGSNYLQVSSYHCALCFLTVSVFRQGWKFTLAQGTRLLSSRSCRENKWRGRKFAPPRWNLGLKNQREFLFTVACSTLTVGLALGLATSFWRNEFWRRNVIKCEHSIPCTLKNRPALRYMCCCGN